jgi:DNA-directed RNA polymerase specialized sigma24 family protein
MTTEGSVTGDIRRLPSRDPDAARRLWDAYFQRLVNKAQAYLRTLRVCDDGEDVALSAFKSIILRAAEGRFLGLDDRDGLWRLLLKETWQKAVDRKRRASRHPAIHFSDLNLPDGLNVEEVLGGEPAHPDRVLKRLRELMECLDGPLQRVAQLKLEGYKNWEIAREIHRAEVTVRRYLKEIRERWVSCEEGS